MKFSIPRLRVIDANGNSVTLSFIKRRGILNHMWYLTKTLLMSFVPDPEGYDDE